METENTCTCGPSAPYSSHEWDCPMNPQNQHPPDVTEDELAAHFRKTGWPERMARILSRETLAAFHVIRRDYY